jgi:phosphoglycolate phosphatase
MPLPPIAVFDLDGTLADTAADIIATLNVILVREGLSAIPLDKAYGLIGAGARTLIERGFKVNGRDLTDKRLDALFEDFLSHYEAHIVDRTMLYDGVAAALDQLATDGFRLAVCTNKIEAHSVKLLNILGVADRFAAIAGKDTFDVFKPDPRHLTETIRLAGGDPSRAVMVGDSKTDIATARAAAIPVIGVPFGYTDVPIADLRPDLIVSHYRDMVAAVKQLAG